MPSKTVQQYNEVIKSITLSSEEVADLGQQPWPGGLIFKLFLYFTRRFEQVQAPLKEHVQREVNLRVREATVELTKKFNAKIEALENKR